MKPILLSLLAGSLIVSPAFAACEGDLDIILTEADDNTHVAALAKVLTNASISDVLDSANHPLTEASSWDYHEVKSALYWENSDDFNDFETDKWVPQGITGSADGYAEGTVDGRDAWIVSWHIEDDSSARVTFIDKETNMYRHVLLVYPTDDDDFKEVAIHAGGITWYGDTLWVVDTSVGFRVFDLTNIWEVESGDGVGKQSDGTYTAAGYGYVLPQIRYYRANEEPGFRFSYTSLDRTEDVDTILAGEYQTAGSGEITRFAKWELDPETQRLVLDSDGSAAPSWAFCVGIPRMQGAVSVNGEFFISASNSGAAGDIWTWVPGETADKQTEFWPQGPEDLSYNGVTDELYGLTEVAGGRWIMTYDISTI